MDRANWLHGLVHRLNLVLNDHIDVAGFFQGGGKADPIECQKFFSRGKLGVQGVIRG